MYRVGILKSFLVTYDKERDWAIVKEAERYRMSIYAKFFAATEDSYTALNKESDPIPQNWVVGDPEEVTIALQHFINEHSITDLTGWGLPPGVPPELAAASIELFASDVAPRLKSQGTL